jgi:hypothetical protein
VQFPQEKIAASTNIDSLRLRKIRQIENVLRIDLVAGLFISAKNKIKLIKNI